MRSLLLPDNTPSLPVCGYRGSVIVDDPYQSLAGESQFKDFIQHTLAYLILQAGFLLGYGIHEGLSALGSMNLLASDSPLFVKALILSETIFYHKEGLIGLPMFVLFGWHSKPEILQFVMQYLYTGSLFYIWHRELKKGSVNKFIYMDGKK